MTFAMMGVLMVAGLAWVHAGMWWVGLLLYGLGTIGFPGANIFYDSMIVDVSGEDEFDIVSAYGYAMGYIGGGLLFALNVAMVTKPELFGLADASAAVSASFLSVAIWWAVFTVPLLMGVKETPTGHQASASQAIREGLAQLINTFREVRKALGCSEETARVHFFRARKTMQDLLGSDETPKDDTDDSPEQSRLRVIDIKKEDPTDLESDGKDKEARS